MINYIIAILLLSGCSHFDKSREEFSLKEKEQFLYSFSSINQMISARYKNKKSDLKYITLELYTDVLNEFKGDKAVGLRKDLQHFDIKEVRSDQKYLYVCVYSTANKFGACDSSKCSETEIQVVTSPNEFDKSFEKLNSFVCEPNSTIKGDTDVAK